MPVSLEDHFGAPSTRTATELEDAISERRTRRSSERRDRVRRIVDALD